jgi:hypothetical protein
MHVASEYYCLLERLALVLLRLRDWRRDRQHLRVTKPTIPRRQLSTLQMCPNHAKPTYYQPPQGTTKHAKNTHRRPQSSHSSAGFHPIRLLQTSHFDDNIPLAKKKSNGLQPSAAAPFDSAVCRPCVPLLSPVGTRRGEIAPEPPMPTLPTPAAPPPVEALRAPVLMSVKR